MTANMTRMLFALLLLLPACSGQTDQGAAREIAMEQDAEWLGILRAHRTSHPEAEATDLYKLLHQGVLGPGHMIEDRESAVSFLHREISGLRSAVPESGAPDPLFEQLDPGGEVFRVHLRPFLAAGGDPDSLAEAFIRSASAFDPDAGHGRFVLLWKRLLPGMAALLQEQAGFYPGFSGSAPGRAGLDTLDARLAEAGYPAVRHSEAYRRAYAPAYRVALRRELIRTCPDLFPD